MFSALTETAGDPTSPATGGATLWLTGLASAGKSTLARALAERLAEKGRAVEVLDGDEMRRQLSAELGYSKQDREANVARIGFVAALLARHGVLVLVPAIAPYRAGRDAVRGRHEAEGLGFFEIHVATSLEACRARDVKGLYALQRAGRLAGLTGVDAPYEAPRAPDLRVPTEDGWSVERSVSLLVDLLVRHGLDGG